MPPMGYWGWRPLLLYVFISVWIVGCTDTEEIAPEVPPTQLPPLTLTLRGRTPVATPTPAFLPLAATLSTRVADHADPSHPLHIRISEPTCYESPTDSIVCLGEVKNTLTETLRQIALLANLLDVDGMVLDTQRVVIEQRAIPPGDTAPYRILFPPLPGQISSVSLDLIQVETSPRPPLSLEFENQQETLSDGRYRVQIHLSDIPKDTPDVQVVVTVYDDSGHIVGYRVAEIHHPDQGVQLDILPMIRDTALRHRVYVGIWR